VIADDFMKDMLGESREYTLVLLSPTAERRRMAPTS
jgi:hypothetical protein